MTDKQLMEIWEAYHMDAGWIETAKALGCDSGEIARLEQWDDFLFHCQEKKLNSDEINAIFGQFDKARIEYLSGEIKKDQRCLNALFKAYQGLIDNDAPGAERLLIIKAIKIIQKQKRNHECTVAFLEGKYPRDTLIDIDRAKQREIAEFIEVRNGKAVCPFHEDHNPSMLIRNGRAHCFGCGWDGDVIDFIQAKKGLSFVEAVRYLGNVTP